MDLRIETATQDHVTEILPHLRASDRREVRRAVGYVDKAIRDSVRDSYEAYAFIVDGRVVCLAGVCVKNLLAGSAIPWMVGTDELLKYSKTLCRNNRKFLDKWLQVFEKLENFVDNDNKITQKWLKWLGFELEEPQQYGKLGHLFRRFHRER